MLFINTEDFFAQASAVVRLSRDEEQTLARQMAAGDDAAREDLIRSQFPLVAAYIRKAPPQVQTLQTVYACIAIVEAAVDRFSFQQSGETIAHHLGWQLRKCINDQLLDKL